MDIRLWCPQCGSKNTSLYVTESDEFGKAMKSILTCHDCKSSMGFIELGLGYLPESMGGNKDGRKTSLG